MSGRYGYGSTPYGGDPYGPGRGRPGRGCSGPPRVERLSMSTMRDIHAARSTAYRSCTQHQIDQLQELLNQDDRREGSDFDSGDRTRGPRGSRPGLGANGGDHVPGGRRHSPVKTEYSSWWGGSRIGGNSTNGGSREGRPSLGLQGIGPGSGGRRSSPASSYLDDLRNYSDGFLEEADFGGGSAFGGPGSRLGGHHGYRGSKSGGGSPSRSGSPSPGSRFGGRAPGPGISPFTGHMPFFGDLPSSGLVLPNPYAEYGDFGGYFSDDDTDFLPPGPGLSLGFDSEFLHGAVGDDEDMDDVISRLMAAGPGQGEGAPPASQDAIANLKKKKVDRSMLGADGNADCAVCMDNVAVGEDVTELPCKHWFHGECITHWLLSHGTCPHCRESITLNDSPRRRNRAVPGDPSWPDPYGEYYRPSPRYDEVMARRMQRRLRPSAREDESYARRLQEEYRSSVQEDEVMARRLQEEFCSPVHDDEAMARRLQEEYSSPVYGDEDIARRMQEESGPSTHNNEARARRF